MKIYNLLVVSFIFVSVCSGQVIQFPDPQFKNVLLTKNCADLNGDSQPEGDADLNNNGEIEVNEAIQVINLYINYSEINDLTGIHFFSNLELLGCFDNNLTSLDLSSNTKLKFLSCARNELTSLVLTNLYDLETLLCYENMLTGLDISASKKLKSLEFYQNSISSIDLTGLDSLHTLDCSRNTFTDLFISDLASLTSLNCNNMDLNRLEITNCPKLKALGCYGNKLTSLNVFEFTEMESFHCMGNLLDTLDVSNLSKLSVFDCYGNNLRELNLSGVDSLKFFDCSNNQLTHLDLSSLTVLQTIECQRNQLEAIDITNSPKVSRLNADQNQLKQLFIKNGKREFWLDFNSNPDLQYICADTIQFSQIHQKLNSYGMTNVLVSDYCSFTPGGTFYTVSGHITLSSNDTICDSLDGSYPFLPFNASSNGYTFSTTADNQGDYSLYLLNGTYIIKPFIENDEYFDISPDSLSVTFPENGPSFLQDFCVTPAGMFNDLEIYFIPLTSARPGFEANYRLVFKNTGTTTLSGAVTLDYTGDWMNVIHVSVTPDIVTNDLMTWYFNDLQPFRSQEIFISFLLNSPQDSPPLTGDEILIFKGNITPSSNDETPGNNTFTLMQNVVNSYDPNEKICLEGDVVTPAILENSLHYLIRFENKGTAEALNIVIKDTIDTEYFDIQSIFLETASHPVYMKVYNNNIVEFIFENIELPFEDSINDGYVLFKIKVKPDLQIGNVLANKVDIFFDYNFGIETNTATTLLQQEQIIDADHDGYDASLDCNDYNSLINPEQSEITYNGSDDDCNPLTLDDDLDQDGYNLIDDCNDADANINPGETEIPDNQVDEDCDGIDLITSVPGIENYNFLVYPNPVWETLNIGVDPSVSFSYKLYDVTGIICHVNRYQNRLNVSLLPAGVYFLEILNYDNKVIQYQKIIIK